MGTLQKIHAIITSIIFLMILVVSAAIVWEWQQPITNYFTHYGNITEREVYVPDDGGIRVYAFGSAYPGIQINIIHRLWCVSADSISRQWVLIGTKYSITHENLNALPAAIVAAPLTKHKTSSDFGSADRKKLQNIVDGGWKLKSFSLDLLHPSVTSSCYVESTWSTPSNIFRMDKSIEFKSGEFAYVVPDE